MRLAAPDVRIADVATCDFELMPSHDTASVLRTARPDDWERCLEATMSRGMLRDLGVERRYLTHLPGSRPDPRRLTAYELACSAVARLQMRRRTDLAHLDAIIFVSTSNPHPCNSQAAMLAGDFGLGGSCLDLKAGCSSGILGLQKGALMIQGGADRVLVVMAENLSHLTPPDDLRMLLTVGDGAACVLLERSAGPGFVTMLHGTAARHARAMAVVPTFPPVQVDTEYAYRVKDAVTVAPVLRERWRGVFHEALAEARLSPSALAHWFFHQTHRAQVDDLLQDLGVPAGRTVRTIETYGNMGTPTVMVGLAERFARIGAGERYLLQAVGGGVSWAAIVAEHA